MKNYALIGAAGFVAPRHMRAIKETGGNLVAACDISDSVGILDSYFPDCEFFTSPERFERHVERTDIDYFVVCTPNYLHDNHIRMGLRAGADIICEKPMVIKPKNVESLVSLAGVYNKKINVIQQLRLHPVLEDIDLCLYDDIRRYTVMVNYVTPRGQWYHQSWKGDNEKSGGLAMNIGVHIFDLLIQLFGKVTDIRNVDITETFVGGLLEHEYANVDFHLSIGIGSKAKRELIVNGELIDLSQGFEDLHTKSYQEILAGRGFGPEDVLPALELVDDL